MRKVASIGTLGTVIVISFIYLIGLSLFNACRKIDSRIGRPKIDNTTRFFTVSPDVHPAIAKVVRKIQQLNSRRNFVNDFVARHGFAIWDKSIVIPLHTANNSARIEAEEYSLLIPLVWDSANLVHAAIGAKVTEDSVFFTLMDGSNYGTYNSDSATKGMNGRQLSATLMYLDNFVFSHNLFQITDSSAFPCKGNNVQFVEAPDSVVTTSSSERTVIISYVICYTTWVPPHEGQVVGCPPGYPNCNGYVPVTNCDFYNILADDGYDLNEGDPPPPPEGGGGGTGGGNELCRYFPGTEHNCGSGGPPGWVPIEEEYDPYESVPVSLDTSITNNFPCVAKIMDSIALMFNVPVTSQLSLKEAFGIEKRLHLTYKINPNWTRDSLDGHTKVDPAYTHEESDDFFATIEINPWVLANSTHEYIAATIIHEAVHAYINYKYWQYTSGIIDSTEFKTLFPLYWPPRTLGYANQMYLYNIGNTAQHQAMAGNLIDIMAAPLAFVNTNPSISSYIKDSINRAITWGGLQGTTVWNTKSDTCNIKAINSFARDPDNVNAPFMQTSGGCSLTSNDDASTLHMKKGCL